MKLKLYLWILGISVTTVFVCNALFLNPSYSVRALALYAYLNSIGIFGMDAVVATVIHKMPAVWFSPYHIQFHSFKWERKFFNSIHIVTWKDYIPDTGKLTTGLSKSEIASTKPEYLYHFLVETCYAETLHYGMAITGVITILINPHKLIIPMMLPLALINFCLNIPPALIQRSNRPKLLFLYTTQLHRQAAKQSV
jgi:hypothetical protein